MQFIDEAKAIWKNFVPRSGQADTVQGELIRAIAKLEDEAIRNGNGNWDDGFELLLDFLHQHLLDPRVYSAETIESTSRALVSLREDDDAWLDTNVYDALSDRAVEYFRFYGSQPHQHNPHLYR